MNYLYALYETYNLNKDLVGEKEIKHLQDKTVEFTLLPISHTTEVAHIEVVVTKDGEFYDAQVLNEKKDIVIPCSEESASRTNNYVPHALHDELKYVAGDYVKFTGQEDKLFCYQEYIKQLYEWCSSQYNHPDVVAIYNYLKKGRLIEDLVKTKCLYIDKTNRLLSKWNNKLGEEKPLIFSIVKDGQEKVFIRFDVHHPGEHHVSVWENKEIFDLYVQYYNTKLKDKDICYVTGEKLPTIHLHPKKIRHSKDQAKLISSNDKRGFTFRGRFKEVKEVSVISYGVSQKAHNALKWLINRQGKIVDGKVFLIWGWKNINIPQVTEDLLDESFSIFKIPFHENKSELINTRKGLARLYNQLLDGINKKTLINEDDYIHIMILDTATTGHTRLAVLYYRNLHINDYFLRLRRWHEGCNWKHKKKVGDNWIEYYGSPSFYTIAKYAYGPRPSEKLIKTVMERLLPCVIDGRAIPMDIVQNAIQRASNPVAFNEEWEWEQALSVACSLVKKHYEKEEYSVALDRTNTDRDYLFGRLLAVADVLERNALSEADQKRATNAVRYMNAFVRAPLRTWHTIHQNLHPYLMRLGAKARRYTDLFQEINDLFNPNDYNDKPLSGKYLLGYYSQRQDLYTKKEGVDEE